MVTLQWDFNVSTAKLVKLFNKKLKEKKIIHINEKFRSNRINFSHNFAEFNTTEHFSYNFHKKNIRKNDPNKNS